MYVLVRAGLYPGLSVYCLLLTASPVLQSICSGVREILFCTSVLVEQSVCVHPLFVLYCIVYYKSVCACACVCRAFACLCASDLLETGCLPRRPSLPHLGGLGHFAQKPLQNNCKHPHSPQGATLVGVPRKERVTCTPCSSSFCLLPVATGMRRWFPRNWCRLFVSQATA